MGRGRGINAIAHLGQPGGDAAGANPSASRPGALSTRQAEHLMRRMQALAVAPE
jgi:hypothetical protein